MRPLFLSAIPVGFLLFLWVVPGFVVLAILSLLSKGAEKKFKEMMGGENDTN